MQYLQQLKVLFWNLLVGRHCQNIGRLNGSSEYRDTDRPFKEAPIDM
jgi:hypothetical protein